MVVQCHYNYHFHCPCDASLLLVKVKFWIRPFSGYLLSNTYVDEVVYISHASPISSTIRDNWSRFRETKVCIFIDNKLGRFLMSFHYFVRNEFSKMTHESFHHRSQSTNTESIFPTFFLNVVFSFNYSKELE